MLAAVKNFILANWKHTLLVGVAAMLTSLAALPQLAAVAPLLVKGALALTTLGTVALPAVTSGSQPSK